MQKMIQKPLYRVGPNRELILVRDAVYEEPKVKPSKVVAAPKAKKVVPVKLTKPKQPKIPSSGNKRYDSYRYRILKKNLPMELTVMQFEKLLKKRCHYCGNPRQLGIDRVDSSLGYTVNNSVACCSMCNFMKYTFSQKAFLEHIERIYHFQHRDDDY